MMFCPHFGINLQRSENLLKDSLRAEAGARRARMRQRIAARAAERVKELKAQGRREDDIKAEEAAIRAAEEIEDQRLEAVCSLMKTIATKPGLAARRAEVHGS